MEFIDLKAQYMALKPQMDKSIEEVLTSGKYILSDVVNRLEEELAKYVGVKHAITCSDGTSALQLVFMAYEIGPGDAVFCPDMTFIASIEPACMLGATPVFCEIDEKTYNLSTRGLEKQIENVLKEGKLVPKAVVAVDFLGNPADYDEIRRITQKYNLILIEDAAQGIGAKYKGQNCGSFGDIATTSFFPTKPLGCYGDGGAVFTNDDRIADIICSLRVHGKGSSKYDNIRIGINSRLDAVQAAVLLTKMQELEKEIMIRQDIAATYSEALKDILVTPFVSKDCRCSFAQYIIMTENMEKRDELIDVLKSVGIPTILYYPKPMHDLPVFKGTNNYGETYEQALKYSECALGIPFSPYLTQEDQDFVIKTIRKAFSK